MHIASGLTFVRRDPAQSDVATGRTRRLAWVWTPERATTIRARLRKLLPGVILISMLVVLGAVFPILF